jgi:hypothetical protein
MLELRDDVATHDTQAPGSLSRSDARIAAVARMRIVIHRSFPSAL